MSWLVRGIVKCIHYEGDKDDCPLHDMSSEHRHWCDGNNDPEDFERCPIPNKAKGE